MTASEDYATLQEHLKRIHILESVSSLLGWDEQVMLPPGSAGQRQDQMALLAQMAHEAGTDPDIGHLLDRLEARDLESDWAVVVKHERKRFDRATKLPKEFVEKQTRLCSEAYHVWAEARANNDFERFAPYLENQVNMAREKAELLGWGDRPYDLALDLHDPGMRTETVDRLFSELRSGLAPVAKRILDSSAQSDIRRLKGFPIEKQEAFLKEVTADLGFDYQRGRIDKSIHPFCGGNGGDVRMTTRFDPDNPLDSLFSAIHETGHGLYEQGLAAESLHNALGKSVGMGVHESQSRLWENQVARSRDFWRFYEPKFRQAFSEELVDVSSEELYQAINAVGRTPIRVDADEVTYNLHVIIRFEIEKRLFDNSLKVHELPDYWNSQYEELIGIRPSSDAEGVLQDIHWSSGAFGYFPSYCLGNMLAAQLWYTAQAQIPELKSDFGRGEFNRLLRWLRQNIHDHGSRYELMELTEKVTGKPLSPRDLIRYLDERYSPMYC